MFNLLRCRLVGSVCRTKLGVSRPDGFSLQVSGTGVLAGTSSWLHNSQLQHLGRCTNTNIAQTSSASEVVHLPAIDTHKPTFQGEGSTEFIDIHDIGGFDPKEFDILISDVGVSQLKHGIADAAGIPYHSPATKEEADAVVKIGDCFIYGRNLRTMFPAVVKRSGKAFWIVFLVDTGVPITYLSAETSDLFGISAIREDTPVRVRIAGRQHRVFRAPRCSHISDINILGADFLDANEASLVYNPDGEEGKVFFDGIAWRVLVKGEKL